MKLIKFSIIAFALLFSVQFAKAQSISIGATFGNGYGYPHHRVIVTGGYPGYAYYSRPAYYGYGGYYARPYYPGRYYGRHPYYREHRYYRHW
ncbi:hypothetical protein [Mucilaginibacter sp. SP1R1]|uniref:hypothetical protein n=1 Tax=Mucilaginibacter sp. SP1R1 TaxID=2723091 RepID=UPI00161B6A03|nr:hypothetical protein [Mucilaginibacter sp. SP1R1]MBB6151430.1 hypothetical protein [Mucilaginibacter sp. SP1R1]